MHVAGSQQFVISLFVAGSMTNSLRHLVDLMCRGVRDSVVGTVSIYHMEQHQRRQLSEDEDSESSPHRQPQEPLSTLARRRAERIKHRDPPKNK